MGFFFNLFKRHPKESDEETIKRIQEEFDFYQNKINAELYAEFVVIEYISKLFSMAEIQIMDGIELKKGDEYYRWNIRPNDFQTGVEFKKEIVARLLLNEEVLIFEDRNNLIIADPGFNVSKKGSFPYRFSNVSRDGERYFLELNSRNSIYLTYETSEIRRKLKMYLNGIQSLITEAATNYEISATHKGILEISALARGNKDLEKQIDDILNKQFKQFYSSKRSAVLPLYEGMNYKDLNADRSSTKKSEIADIKTLTDEMISKSAISHGVKPSVILGDKENTEIATKETISNAIKPIASLLEAGINASDLFGKRNYISGKQAKINLAPLRYNTVFDDAEASDKLIATGQYSIDDLRVERGDMPLNTDWSRMHFITLNYQPIEQAIKNSKGGE